MPTLSINQRIAALRQAMQQADLDAYIVLSSDPHQSEIVAPRYQSRAWISGFTGSAGTAVVTRDHAGLWTDSRYFLQADIELADSEFQLHRKERAYLHEYESWLLEHLPAGSRVGVDGQLIGARDFKNLKKSLQEGGLELMGDHDLIEAAWEDRPALPGRPVRDFGVEWCGETRSKRIVRVQRQLEEHDWAATLLVALDDIAWLFNLRGTDVEFNPLFYAYAVVAQDSSHLFISPGQVSPALKADLVMAGIQLHDYTELLSFIQDAPFEGPIHYDPRQLSAQFADQIPESLTQTGDSLVVPMKAIRNPVEIKRTRQAMVKDGVALLRLFRWLEGKLEREEYPTEVDVAEQLAQFRSEQKAYQGESFAAIAGYAGNGAIVHYRPEPKTAATLRPEGIFLLDSGGQYLDGTTDITRTIALGPPTAAQKQHYTLVLKGHIALARAVFLPGTRGNQLDLLARQYLWREGLNYGHGTGHGVGFFLNVHEGPHGVSPNPSGSPSVPLEPGMVFSNEPGYYLAHHYGIRIENLVLVRQHPFSHTNQFLSLEDLTLFPMDWNLIQEDLLTMEEEKWLHDYHQTVFQRLSPHLEAEEQAWLKEKCRV